MDVTETPEETTRWRVRRIRRVLADAGLPHYDRDFPSGTVRQAGHIVSSRAGEHDCVYTEWIECSAAPSTAAPSTHPGPLSCAVNVATSPGDGPADGRGSATASRR